MSILVRSSGVTRLIGRLLSVLSVCAENLNPNVMMVKAAKRGT
jgi:hypothetical protein